MVAGEAWRLGMCPGGEDAENLRLCKSGESVNRIVQ